MSMASTAGALALTDAFVGAFTEGGAAWAGTASIPATTSSDSRASARRDRIIVFILLDHGWRVPRTPRADLDPSILVPHASPYLPPASRRGEGAATTPGARAGPSGRRQVRPSGALSRGTHRI